MYHMLLSLISSIMTYSKREIGTAFEQRIKHTIKYPSVTLCGYYRPKVFVNSSKPEPIPEAHPTLLLKARIPYAEDV